MLNSSNFVFLLTVIRESNENITNKLVFLEYRDVITVIMFKRVGKNFLKIREVSAKTGTNS